LFDGITDPDAKKIKNVAVEALAKKKFGNDSFKQLKTTVVNGLSFKQIIGIY